MKFMIALLTTLVAFQASARLESRRCTGAEEIKIKNALYDGKIRKGDKYAGHIIDSLSNMSTDELPKDLCLRLVGQGPGSDFATATGERYQYSTGYATFTIDITNDDDGRSSVAIQAIK